MFSFAPEEWDFFPGGPQGLLGSLCRSASLVMAVELLLGVEGQEYAWITLGWATTGSGGCKLAIVDWGQTRDF